MKQLHWLALWAAIVPAICSTNFLIGVSPKAVPVVTCNTNGSDYAKLRRSHGNIRLVQNGSKFVAHPLKKLWVPLRFPQRPFAFKNATN